MLIHINASINNTIFTITNSKGDTLFWKGSKHVSIEAIALQVCLFLNSLNCKKVHIKLNGIGPGRISSIKGLKKGGLRIISIQDVTPIPHNGCRPSKKRRL